MTEILPAARRRMGEDIKMPGLYDANGMREIAALKARAETAEARVAELRRAVFDLSEGEVVITYPDDLSAESVADFQDYLAVFMKKLRREAGITESSKPN